MEEMSKKMMIGEMKNGVLTLYADGRIDSYTVADIEEEINACIREYYPEKVVLDCEKLTYIASAGLRVLLRIGKERELAIVNVSREVYEVLEQTGFTGMFDTKKAVRQVKLDGCPVVGAGMSSTVYRYDRETVVKLFAPRVTLDRIYKETASAKKSFVAGIPTAIPYDVVRCGESYGTVFELIDADTLSQNLMDHPEQFDELMDKYVSLLKQFHGTSALNGTFPDIREKYHQWAAGLKKYMSDEEIAVLYRLIDAVPCRQTMIHVDCHSRNIMVQNGKLIFVDMADVSIGHPLFDIGAEYFHYVILRSTTLGARVIFGVEPEDEELPLRVWDGLVERYFAGFDGEKMSKIRKMLRYFGCLRCLIMVAKHAHMEPEAARELVDRQRRDLLPYAEEAATLFAGADEFFR